MLALQVYQKPLPQVTTVFYQRFNSFSIPLNTTPPYLLVLLIILNNYCSYIPYKLLKVFSLYFSLYSVVLLIYNTVLWTLNGDVVFEVFFELCVLIFLLRELIVEALSNLYMISFIWFCPRYVRWCVMCLSVLHSPLHVYPCAASFLQLLLLNLPFHFGSPTFFTYYLLMFDVQFHGIKLKMIWVILLK